MLKNDCGSEPGREELLPSEKAFAYKMKMDAMRRQGARTDLNTETTSNQIGWKLESADYLSEEAGESKTQIRRYIRLTELIPGILDLVDCKRIKFTVGVEISYLDKEIQQWIYEYIKENGVLKLKQVTALREQPKDGGAITQAKMITLFQENQPEGQPASGLTFTEKRLRQYFPPNYTAEQMRTVIENLLKEWRLKESEAKKRKAEIECELENGTFTIPTAKNVNDLLDEFFAIYGINNWAMSTYESRRNLMSNYVRTLIGEMQLSALNTRVMDQFYRSLQKVKPVVVNNVQPKNEFVTAHTVREIHKILRTAFNQAVKWELMSKNPVVNATLPKEEHVPRNIWTADTLFKALDVCDDDMLRLALNLAFSCSLRRARCWL